MAAPLSLLIIDPLTALALLLDATAKSLLILILAALAALLLRRSSASLRHLIWTAATAGLLVVPLLSVWLPQLQVPLLPRWPMAELQASAPAPPSPGVFPPPPAPPVLRGRVGEGGIPPLANSIPSPNVEHIASPESPRALEPLPAMPPEVERQTTGG